MPMSPQGNAGYSSSSTVASFHRFSSTEARYTQRGSEGGGEKTGGGKIERNRRGAEYGLTKTDGDTRERVGHREK